MTVPLDRILPAASGRAVDARLLAGYLAGHPDVDELVLGWANAFHTRFDGRIEGRSRALGVLGGQVAALLTLVHPLVERLREALPDPVAGLVFTDAVGAATAARLLAEADRQVDPDVVSLLALLRGLGPAIALAEDAEAQLRWWREVRRAWGPQRDAASQELFGDDPACQIGSLALDLGAAPELATAIAGLDEHAFAAGSAPTLHRATRLVHALGAVDSGPALHAWVDACPLPEPGAWALIGEVLKRTPELARLLDLTCHPWPALDVLQRRTGALDDVVEPMELQMLVRLQSALIHELRADVTRAQVQVNERLRVDTVTDLPSFQVFVERLGAALDDPEDRIGTLLALDLTDFGAVFVSEGLRTSDHVLLRVAATLTRLFPDAELLTRCGPATFLVGLPDAGRSVRFATERAREVLGRLDLRGRRGPIRLQVRAASLDLAELPPDADAEAIIEATRRALDTCDAPRWRRAL